MKYETEYVIVAGVAWILFEGGTSVRKAPAGVDAPPESFVGLRYLGTDGSDLWCYHSEQGHVRGGDIDVRGAAFQIATREPTAGWSIGG